MTQFLVIIDVVDIFSGITIKNYEFKLDARTEYIAENICMENVKKEMKDVRRSILAQRYNISLSQIDAMENDGEIDLLSAYHIEIHDIYSATKIND